MKKKVNWGKIMYYSRKCMSYYGAINLGIFIGVGLAYGWFTEVFLGMGLSIFIMIVNGRKL